MINESHLTPAHCLFMRVVVHTPAALQQLCCCISLAQRHTNAHTHYCPLNLKLLRRLKWTEMLLIWPIYCINYFMCMIKKCGTYLILIVFLCTLIQIHIVIYTNIYTLHVAWNVQMLYTIVHLGYYMYDFKMYVNVSNWIECSVPHCNLSIFLQYRYFFF